MAGGTETGEPRPSHLLWHCLHSACGFCCQENWSAKLSANSCYMSVTHASPDVNPGLSLGLDCE